MKGIVPHRVAKEVQVKIIFKPALLNGTGFNFSQVKAEGGEVGQYPVEGSRGVGDREHQTDFVGTGFDVQFAGDGHKTGAVVFLILDAVLQNDTAVLLGRLFGSDSRLGNIIPLGDGFSRRGGAGVLDGFGPQGGHKGRALPQGLGMGISFEWF